MNALRALVVIVAAVASVTCVFAPASVSAQLQKPQAAVPATPTPAPQPSASASPTTPAATSSPSPSPAPGFHLSADFATTFIDQAVSGPGLRAFEVPAYISGFPAAPLTPYDLISANIQTPGLAGNAQLRLKASNDFRNYEIGLEVGVGYARGSVAQLAYWNEPLIATLNPHLNAPAVPMPLNFPTHAGQDSVTALRTSILSGYAQTKDQRVKLQAGWITLGQSDAFVFTQPTNPTVLPALSPQMAETLGNGGPSLDGWAAASGSLPVHGVDLQIRPGPFSFELSDVDLAAPSNTPARATIASLVFEKHDKFRLSAQYVHVHNGGDPVSSPLFFGSDATLTSTTEGNLSGSTIHGERESILGFRSAFTNLFGFDSVVAEIGRSAYGADSVAKPGGPASGGYYHLGVTKTAGRKTFGLDGYRFDPNYGSIFLPYSAYENQWNASFAWPGQWLKSAYQMVDNSVIGVNRQGYRLRYALDGGPFELHAGYMNYAQVSPTTLSTASTTGYVEPLIPVESSPAGTLATQKRYMLWMAWHRPWADVTLDLVEDTLHRDPPVNHPEDAVSYDVPEAVLTVSRTINKSMIVLLGTSRFAMRGDFARGGSTNLDFAQRTLFIGALLGVTQNAGTLVEVRRFSYSGLPITPGSGPTSYTGTLFLLEQRFHL